MKRIKSVLVKAWDLIKSSKKWQAILSGILAVVIGGAGFAVGYSVGNKPQDVNAELSSEEIGSSEEGSSVEESSEEIVVSSEEESSVEESSEEESSSENDSSVEDEEERKPSEGLEYTLSDDGTYYIVTGIGTCTDTVVVIPNTYEDLPVEHIGRRAFEWCSSLTEVVVPDGVTSIDFAVFFGCSSLTKVVIPNGVTSIGESAFGSCSSLMEVEIPDSVTSIGDMAFFRCSGLTEVVIPDNVTSIGEFAFENCSSLTEVVIGDKVSSIGDGVFFICSSLTNITVKENNTWYSSLDGNLYNKDQTMLIQYASGKTDKTFTISDCITSIVEGAFWFSYDLMEILVDENNSNYSSLDGNLYNKDQTTLIQYGIGKTDSLFIIPDGVKSIFEAAFADCAYLTEIIIPNSVTNIDNWAFQCCDSLTSVKFEGTVEQWEAIYKDDYWNDQVPATEVVCNNGVVPLT